MLLQLLGWFLLLCYNSPALIAVALVIWTTGRDVVRDCRQTQHFIIKEKDRPFGAFVCLYCQLRWDRAEDVTHACPKLRCYVWSHTIPDGYVTKQELRILRLAVPDMPIAYRAIPTTSWWSEKPIYRFVPLYQEPNCLWICTSETSPINEA